MPKTASVAVTFGLPCGGEHVERLRVDAGELYRVRGAPGVKARAAKRASKRGVKLGNCLRIVHKKCAVWLYQIDTTARFMR